MTTWRVLFFSALVLFFPCPAKAVSVLVDLPSSCFRLDGASNGSELHFASVPGVCDGSTRVPVEVPEGTKRVRVYLDGTLRGVQEIHDTGLAADVEDIQKRVRALEIPALLPPSTEASRAAAAVFAVTKRAAFQEKVAEAGRDLRRLVSGKTGEAASYPDQPELEKGAGRALPANERLYIFVSSSMPLSTLRNYAADLARLKDPAGTALYIRGVVGGNLSVFRPTIDFIAGVLVKEGGCDFKRIPCPMMPAEVTLDAEVFRRYGIDRVPAFVYARGVTTRDSELSEGNSDNTQAAEASVLYGDAPLEKVLETFAEETGSASMAAFLERLRFVNMY
jgi:type-F conjugative transfer system pilin assembly protein TrbC